MKSLSAGSLSLLLLVGASESVAGLPMATVPDGLGVNIHFTGEPSRDLDMLQVAGFKFVRMDLQWDEVEKQEGVYNFTAYDQLTEGLSKRQIRPLYILDYSNKLYEKDCSVQTAAGRQAFASFASAAARHYRGKGVIWELWNEPNLAEFWQPQPGVNDYMALAKAVFPAMRKADPQAFLVAPATSRIPLDFLEECFQQGLLQMVDAITVHPYRQSSPETLAEDVLRLRALVTWYRPDRPDLPILSGEWGYSSVWDGFNDERQGQYLPRQFLMNLSLGIPISIWYDWRDDGTEAKNYHHHLGTVTYDYQPKPCYRAMQKLVQFLGGLQFVKRLQSPPDDYLLFFSDGHRDVVAAWSTGPAHDGELVPGQKIQFGGGVQYISVPSSATNLLAEGAWTVKAKSPAVLCGAGDERLAPEFAVSVRNPFKQKIFVEVKTVGPTNLEGQFVDPQTFELDPGKSASILWKGQNPVRRDKSDLAVTVETTVAGVRRQQVVLFTPVNPMTLDVAQRHDGKIAAVLRLREGDKVKGNLVCEIGSARYVLAVDLNVAAGVCKTRPLEPAGSADIHVLSSGGDVIIPLPWKTKLPDDSISFQLMEGTVLAADSGICRIVPLDVSTNTAVAVNDGDPKVQAKFVLSLVPCADVDTPVERILQLSYDFGDGWKFVRISPLRAQTVEKAPKAIRVWVRGNQSNCSLNMRFVDGTGRTFQPTFGKLDFTGWRLLTARLDDPSVGHWGGTGEGGKIVYPIRINTFILVDGVKLPVKDEVGFTDFHLIYTE